MSCSSTRNRGQTEPVAALLAVALVAVAVAAHAGLLGAVLPGQSERSVAAVTAERVWEDLRTDGVYYPGGGTLADDSMPAGRVVSVEVSRLTDAGWQRDWAATWRPGGYLVKGSSPPDRARVTTRPIPVRKRNGVIVPGRLRVAVWEP